MNGKRGLQLDRVVLLGRTFDEYCAFFGVTAEQLRGKRVLDVAAGVSSFSAEAAALGIHATATDPIYDWTPEKIAERCEPDLEAVYRSIGSKPAYRWGERSYRSPEHMRDLRARASAAFLRDYAARWTARSSAARALQWRDELPRVPFLEQTPRYIPAALPNLPFSDGEFDLALTSYFLFVYEDQFDYEFHRASILELMRVAKEARIYPLVTFEAERSACLDRLLADPALAQFRCEEIRTEFEFLLNSNAFLKIENA